MDILSTVGQALEVPYAISHEIVSKLWDDASEYDATTQVAMRVSAVVLGAILFPLTYPLVLVGKLLQSRCFHNIGYEEGQKLYLQVEALRRSGSPGWQERAVSLIRNSRQASLDDEWERLRGTRAITYHEEREIANAVQNVRLTNPHGAYERRKQAKVLLGQAHELKKLYGDTHHVFIHGQSLTCSVIPLLLKDLIRRYNPEKAIPHFKFLRNETSAVSDDKVCLTDRLKDFLGMSADTPPTVWEYIKQFWWISDDDHKMREMLLSADGYFYNSQTCESALYFLMNNSNILGSNYRGSLTSLIESILSHFKRNASKAELQSASSEVIQSIRFTETMTTTGNLYAIAIPKAESSKVQYRAHPFGSVCTCHQRKNHTEILDKLQRGILDGTTKCNGISGALFSAPQFRLYTKALSPENGCKIFRMTPLAKDKWQSIKTSIKRIVSTL